MSTSQYLGNGGAQPFVLLVSQLFLKSPVQLWIPIGPSSHIRSQTPAVRAAVVLMASQRLTHQLRLVSERWTSPWITVLVPTCCLDQNQEDQEQRGTHSSRSGDELSQPEELVLEKPEQGVMPAVSCVTWQTDLIQDGNRWIQNLFLVIFVVLIKLRTYWLRFSHLIFVQIVFTIFISDHALNTQPAEKCSPAGWDMRRFLW